MNRRNNPVILFLLLAFTAASLGKPVFAQPAPAGRTDPELEFLIQNARENIKTQEAIINSLRKRYKGLLKRKKELQKFIDEENKKLKNAELLKSGPSAKPTVKPTKPTPIPPERKALKGQEKDQEKLRVLREEKEALRREKEIAKRMRIQAAALSQEENAGKALEAEGKKKDLDSGRNKKSTEQAALAKKQEKEREALSKKIEKQRLLEERESQRLISEKECQKRILQEAKKKAKHEKYVSQLEKLLNKQNSLLEETYRLESKIAEEEKNLEVLEKTRQDLIKKLLEKP